MKNKKSYNSTNKLETTMCVGTYSFPYLTFPLPFDSKLYFGYTHPPRWYIFGPAFECTYTTLFR